MPMILYNEKLLGQVLTLVTVSSVLALVNFVGYKDSTRDILHLLEVIELMPKEKDIIAGSDSMIYETYVLGGSGIVSLVINPFPELVVRIVNELENKNYESALLMQIKINRVRSILKSYGFSSGYREACRFRGIDCGDPYLSTEKMTEKQKEELEQKLTLEGLV
jgi:dihydrodipicolinate synthase/N-acetylneuraminate lyase